VPKTERLIQTFFTLRRHIPPLADVIYSTLELACINHCFGFFWRLFPENVAGHGYSKSGRCLFSYVNTVAGVCLTEK
jgi:hypothetical protein